MHVVDCGDDRDLVSCLPDGKGYVGVHQVIVGGDYHCCLMYAEAFICGRVILVTEHNFKALVMKVQGLVYVTFNDYILIVIFTQLLYEL